MVYHIVWEYQNNHSNKRNIVYPGIFLGVALYIYKHNTYIYTSTLHLIISPDIPINIHIVGLLSTYPHFTSILNQNKLSPDYKYFSFFYNIKKQICYKICIYIYLRLSRLDPLKTLQTLDLSVLSCWGLLPLLAPV